jgi:hypothetical protein
MQQRQLRLGDILDDYCPRERRVTNHAVVAMVGADVKQTRCTTCDAEHEYKHAKVPRPRQKMNPAEALRAQALGTVAKRSPLEAEEAGRADVPGVTPPGTGVPAVAHTETSAMSDPREAEIDERIGPSETEDGAPGADDMDIEDGPVHRPLIRATLPRLEGQPPPARPSPDFTIRQPGGRPSRFRPRYQRTGGPFQGNRPNGNVAGGFRGGPRQGGVRPPHGSQGSLPRPARRHGPGGKRSK